MLNQILDEDPIDDEDANLKPEDLPNLKMQKAKSAVTKPNREKLHL